MSARPAGDSSSEDEWVLDDEAADLESHPVERVTSFSPNNGSSQLSSNSSDVCSNPFEWTKFSCARRANANAKKQPVPKRPKENGLFLELKETKKVETKKIKASTENVTDVAISEWVAKKLKEFSDSPSVPIGSAEVDEKWLAEISDAWLKKKSKNASTYYSVVHNCLNNVPNPFSTALYIMENVHSYVTGKRLQLLNSFLGVFGEWLRVNPHKFERCLDERIRLRAFACAAGASTMCAMKLVEQCFQLKASNNPEDFIVLIRQILDRFDYLKASRCIVALSLQNRFSLEEVCIPLFLQGYVGQEIEDYLYEHKGQQIQFIKMLDSMVDPSFSFDYLYRDYYVVPKVRRDLLEPKKIQKLVVRLMKLYEIPDEVCPCSCRHRSVKALHYLIYQKYIHKNLGETQWIDLILAATQGEEFLQLDFINKIVDDFLDYETAAKAVSWFNLPTHLLPSDLKNYLVEAASESGSSLVSMMPEVTAFDDQTPNDVKKSDDVEYHKLILPLSSVYWVDGKEEYMKCIEHVKSGGNVVAFDAEWRPLLTQTNGSRIALLQLAVEDAIFLLDMVTLVGSLSDNDWMLLADILCSDHTVPLAYACQEDLVALSKAVPVLQQCTRLMKVLDLSVTHAVLRRNMASSFGPEHDVLEGDITPCVLEDRGLSDLVRLCLGHPLDKSQRLSDWQRRPLREEQVVYAALDAFCLLEIYNVLKKRAAEFHVTPEILDSRVTMSQQKTKLMTKQQRLQTKYSSNEATRSERSLLSGESSSAISPSSLRVVCDTMLTGLGRHLRLCGVDVSLLKENDPHDIAAQIARREDRVVLTSGMPYFTLRSQLSPGRCYNVQAKDIEGQASEVLQHFHVAVTPGDVFSRCQICNGAQYLQVHALELKEAWRRNEGLTRSTESDFSALNGYDHIDLETLRLTTGVPIMLGKIPESKFDQVKTFFVCNNCGKVYWEGAHHRRVGERLAHLIKDECTDLA